MSTAGSAIDLAALTGIQERSYQRAGDVVRQWPPESAMDGPALEAFLAGRRYCVMATASPTGRPAARPIAFTVLGASFWFATVTGTRLRNLRHTPWASVVIEEGDGDCHWAVAVDGPVSVSAAPAPGLLEAWARAHGTPPGWTVGGWLELVPERLLSYRAREART